MRRREYLGSFELVVLLAVMRLDRDAYGVPISREIEGATGREVAIGSVYATLARLEAKGLVASHVGEPTAERGGRAKRYFTVTGKGQREVRQTQHALRTLWEGVPQLQGGMA
jgi:PadR family transcriptional regulator, regulatory protein PadR